MVGGKGSDLLYGEEGSDTYRYASGDGNDTINDYSASKTDIDRLELSGLNPSGVTLQRQTGSYDLRITIGGQSIDVVNHFNSKGLEEIAFADGTVWTSADIFARTWVLGDNSANTSYGLSTTDNMKGLGGNDTLFGGAGDDYLYGGTENDSLSGGAGNDWYIWSAGSDNDTIDDGGTSLTEVDSLMLSGLSASDVDLTRDDSDLLITMRAGGEEIRVVGRFASGTSGQGIEVITFEDGSIARILDSDVATVELSDTGGLNTLTGWGFRDLIKGLAGNDTLSGMGGSDTLEGGAGIDALLGGEGADSYHWSSGEGADTITDTSTSLTAVDRLVLKNVLMDDVALVRLNNSNNLIVRVTTGSDTEDITVTNRFASTTSGAGVDAIEFKDGTVWYLDEILDRTVVKGDSGNDTLTGTSYRDNLFGRGSADSLYGGAGRDQLVGGTADDSLEGGTGADSYVWARNDGDDTINDGASSISETDTLVLQGVLPSDLTITRANGSSTLVLTIAGTEGGTLSILNGMTPTVTGQGIERIVFDNGTIWDHLVIQTETRVSGTPGNVNETLNGTDHSERLYGYGGSDVINGYDGEDKLTGDEGNDSVFGGNGADTYVWREGDGADTLNDDVLQRAEADVLHLDDDDVASSAVVLRRESGSNDLIVRITTSGGTTDLRIVNQYHSVTAVLQGGYGIEVIRFADGSEWTLEDIRARAVLYGGSGNDLLTGSVIGDRIDGAAGNDTLNGLAGDDSLDGGTTGADLLDGGAGVDTANYAGSAAGVTVNLGLTTAQTGAATAESTGDTLISIEGVIGSAHADTITGDALSNLIQGGSGDDTLSGMDGYDQIDGETGNDSILGGVGADLLRGGSDNDVLFGGDGDDLLDGGSSGDTLSGEAGADTLIGGSSSDSLSGGDGADTLIGGTGNDTLWGSFGEDVYVFNTALDAATNVDTITYFSSIDLIHLDSFIFSAVGIDLTTSEFRSIETGTSFAAADSTDHIIYLQSTGALYYDSDATGAAAPIQFAQLTAGTVLELDYFVMI